MLYAIFQYSSSSGADPGFLKQGVHMYKGVCVGGGGGVALLILSTFS